MRLHEDIRFTFPAYSGDEGATSLLSGGTEICEPSALNRWALARSRAEHLGASSLCGSKILCHPGWGVSTSAHSFFPKAWISSL